MNKHCEIEQDDNQKLDQNQAICYKNTASQ